MDDSFRDRIRRSRELLCNQYAYVGDDGELEAVLPRVVTRVEATAEEIRSSRGNLLNQYAHLGGDGNYEAEGPMTRDRVAPTGRKSTRPIDVSSLRSGKRRGARFSKQEAEEVARKLLVELWRQRDTLLSRHYVGALDVVDPRMALTTLGFDVVDDPNLGDIDDGGALVAVAGQLDRAGSSVRLSPRFDAETQNFTLAHELGHVLLHEGDELHRDRPLDGTPRGVPRAPAEREADDFAAAFLMPAKVVQTEFECRFCTQHFELSDDTAHQLGTAALDALQDGRWMRDELCSHLARAEFYGSQHFVSLASLFRVSARAMAIRLRELGLVGG